MPHALPSAADQQLFLLDSRNGQDLVLVLPAGALALGQGANVTPLGVTALSARFLTDGAVVFIDDKLALRRLNLADPAHLVELLPPGSANAPLFLSPDGQSLAYLKPIDLPPGETEAATNGIAVLDLSTGRERLLFSVPDVTLRLYGWSGARLLLEVPNWSPATSVPAGGLLLATLDTTVDKPEPKALAQLPALLSGAHYPQTSLDQHLLAYDSSDGLVVAALDGGRYALYHGPQDPLWTENGLTVSQAGQRAAQSVHEADLAQYQPASGPVSLPHTTAPSAPHSPMPPASPDAVFLYRPVKASTHVSAYYDLDRSVGTVADWTGWSGTGWAYGHAYDQHSGTDYDGITGDAVYASALGTVIQVVIDCANTYPGGPATFGSYVRIEHGLQSDGSSYRTLYGHLKCDAVFTSVGAVISALPTQLAQMGNTGWSTGDHTHLQVYRNLVTVDPYLLHIISDSPPISTIGNVVGLVRDGAGQPAAGVLVKLAAGGQLQSMLTGSDGRYSFSAVKIGRAALTAARDPRWAQVLANILPANTVNAPDLNLSCAATTQPLDGCPGLSSDGATFVADVTLPDTSVLLASQSLVKTWRLQNTGSSTWGPGVQLVFIGGAVLAGAPAAVDVSATSAGATADLSVSFLASAETGARRTYWRLRGPTGAYFGPTIWAELDVEPAGPAITTFTASPASPSPSSLVQVHAVVPAMPNFRAQRLLIDGAVVAETTSTDLAYDWHTTGLDPVEHSLTLEAADLSDTAWTHPQRRGINYALQPAAGYSPVGTASVLAAHRRPAPSLTRPASLLQTASAVVVPNTVVGTLSPAAPNTGAVLYLPLVMQNPVPPSCVVQALPDASGSAFTVTWAGSGSHFYVQFLDSDRSVWRNWLSGVPATSALFTGQSGHRYSFRCLAENVAGVFSLYPQAGDTATLIGSQSGQPDLRVISLSAEPNPGGGLLAHLTVQNDSGANMQSGFFTDLYLDHSPSGPGDFADSVQTWVSDPLAAGQVATYSAVVAPSGADHNATLVALVDSTGLVGEMQEGNNLSLGVNACLAAQDIYEDDNSPAAASLLPIAGRQPHNLGGPGDRDWMRVDVQPGRMYRFTTINLGLGVDTRLSIYAAGNPLPLAFNDDADITTLGSSLRWTPPTAGVYYLLAEDWNPATGGCGKPYTVTSADVGSGHLIYLPLTIR